MQKRTIINVNAAKALVNFEKKSLLRNKNAT